jgi:hypothetical protein
VSGSGGMMHQEICLTKKKQVFGNALTTTAGPVSKLLTALVICCNN